jgi:hypothetical protein
MSEILGINERSYPVEAADPSDWAGRTSVTVVLVAGDIGDYAAYVGRGSPAWIARHGDKISFAEACCHFPGGQLDEAKYRR